MDDIAEKTSSSSGDDKLEPAPPGSSGSPKDASSPVTHQVDEVESAGDVLEMETESGRKEVEVEDESTKKTEEGPVTEKVPEAADEVSQVGINPPEASSEDKNVITVGDVDTDDDVMEVDDSDVGNDEENKTGDDKKLQASEAKDAENVTGQKPAKAVADGDGDDNDTSSSDSGSIAEMISQLTKPPPKPTTTKAKPKRRVYIDWVCVNPDCTRDGKSNSEIVTTARDFVLGHFGVKIDPAKKRKVCWDCLESAETTKTRMVERLRSGEPIIDEQLPVPREATVTLDDSDQEMHTDTSSESEFEFELTESSTDSEPGDDSSDRRSKKARAALSKLIDAEMKKLNVGKQIDKFVGTLTDRMNSMMEEAEVIDKKFDEMEKVVDNLREDLYRPFRPEVKFLEPVDLDAPKKPVPLADLVPQHAIKRTMPPPPALQRFPMPVQPTFPSQPLPRPQLPRVAQPIPPEIVALPTPTIVSAEAFNLPPVGELVRPMPKLGDRLFAMRGNLLQVWKDGTVIEVVDKENEKQFKLRFEVYVDGKLKNTQKKTLALKHLAYVKPAEVRLQVGTRVIGIFREDDDDADAGNFYSGIIAEPPKQMNRFRYLVFFDDGYASYIKHEDIRVVCRQSEAVWEDVDTNSQEFIQKYLKQYPDRPMVKLTIGQVVRTESKGSWWFTTVEAIDASLVKLHFHINDHREWVYRGSTRLGPLFLEFQEQKKLQESSGRLGISRRNTTFNRNRPYIEYTRQTDDDVSAPGDPPVRRAVARKSTAANRKVDSGHAEPRERWDLKGNVGEVDVSGFLEGIEYLPHTCSKKCLGNEDNELKFQYFEQKMKGTNPLLIPIKLGWRRLVSKFCNNGRRQIFYVAPCGRRLRSMDEVHRYLRVVRSNLEVDFFNFDWFLRVLNEFTPERDLLVPPNTDFSYGAENVPISCVNSIDNGYPDYIDYSTCRIPQTGVHINTDEEFLTCCDCIDDCQDKEKCACWQETVSHTVASNSDPKGQKNIGYQYRRLYETVSTGIFECNQRCKCSKTCLNRVAQNPLRVKLQLYKTEKRGWGVRTLCDIPRGGFICIYVGKLYTNEEANRIGAVSGDEYFAELDLIEVVERNKEGYESDVDDDEDADDDSGGGDVEAVSDDLTDSMSEEEAVASNEKPDLPFVANVTSTSVATDRQTRSRNREKKDLTVAAEAPGKKRDPVAAAAVANADGESDNKAKYVSTRKLFAKDEDVYIMDAKDQGNIGRYLNHSCSPNVFVQNCFVDTRDLRFPWIAFFALDHICAGQELCWDYAYVIGQVPGKQIQCECGAENCRGRLL